MTTTDEAPRPRRRLARLIMASFAMISVAVPITAARADAFDPGEQAPGTLKPLFAGPSTGEATTVGSPARAKAGPRAATIQVNYTGFSTAARASFQRAVNIWQSRLNSSVVIRVQANYQNLGSPNLLGSAGPTTIHRNFSGGKPNTWYPVAIANKIAGQDLNGSQVDLVANFNSSFSNWHFGTGQPAANKYDFETVVLHELGHGLGFLASFFQSGTSIVWGTSGAPWISDTFITNSANQQAIRFASGSANFKNAVTNNNLWWNGPKGKQANNGNKPKLYAPNPWRQGSSASHLDENTYGQGNPNSLMTPFLNQGERILNPGNIAMGMLNDSGWGAAPK